MLGNLLDTLIRVGRRDEALGYLVALGAASCEIPAASLPADPVLAAAP